MNPYLKKDPPLVHEAPSSTTEMLVVDDDVYQLTGTRFIDQAVVGLCPKITQMKEDQRRQLMLLIQSFLDTREVILGRISELTNQDVADYLDGAKSLAEEQTHGLIGDLEVLLEERAQSALQRWQNCE